MRDIKLVPSKASLHDYSLKTGNREDGSGAMAIHYTYEEVYRIFKERKSYSEWYLGWKSKKPY